MVTMTTVGYGDNPTLRQEMRLFTLFFGFVGVTVVAGSINVRAQRCARSTHFRSLMGCAASGRGRAGSRPVWKVSETHGLSVSALSCEACLTM